jgi:hypothetical protein
MVDILLKSGGVLSYLSSFSGGICLVKQGNFTIIGSGKMHQTKAIIFLKQIDVTDNSALRNKAPGL